MYVEGVPAYKFTVILKGSIPSRLREERTQKPRAPVCH